jgi:hypothetical protein
VAESIPETAQPSRQKVCSINPLPLALKHVFSDEKHFDQSRFRRAAKESFESEVGYDADFLKTNLTLIRSFVEAQLPLIIEAKANYSDGVRRQQQELKGLLEKVCWK